MISFLKSKGFLLFLAAVTVAATVATFTNAGASTQTPQVKDFQFSATVNCNLNPIEEIDMNNTRSLTIYYYPVEFLAKSITYDGDAVVLHNVFLYKMTYDYDIYSQPPRTEYFNPAEHPENFFQTVTIYPPSQIVIKKNYNK
jgi:hypothetical protein